MKDGRQGSRGTQGGGSRRRAPDVRLEALVDENQALLRLLCDEIGDLDVDGYVAEADGLAGMSIGRHCRHVGEHYDVLLASIEAAIEASPVDAKTSARAPHASEEGAAAAGGGMGSVATADAILDYDARRRCARFETSPAFAIERLASIAEALEALRARPADLPLAMRARMDSANDAAVATATTLGRELVFLVSHTVHHGALIALLLARGGRTPDPRLWIAASTRMATAPSA
ncbi:MAG TPA: hypothetical protein VLA56_13350 [Pseudomonadales bacterium]|nr:hypothetical protein [Pseudomonadales bacterium]